MGLFLQKKPKSQALSSEIEKQGPMTLLFHVSNIDAQIASAC